MVNMMLEEIRYYFALTCAVLGVSALYTWLITLPIRTVYDFENRQLYTLYLVTYVIIVILGFIYYRKRLRGII